MNKHDQLWVDAVRVIATFSVVWLHSAAPLLYKYNELSRVDWWAGNIYDSMVRMCVPLFFMISGYLLLSKSENISNFFKKRISKVVLPLFAWSVLYILWKHYYQGGGSISYYTFYSIALTPAYYHLWFLYAIVGLYLFMPILRVIVKNSSKELLYYFVVLWFFAVSIIPFFEKITHIDSRIDLKMISGFVGYLVVGHLLGKIEISKQYFILSAVMIFLTISFTSAGTYFLTDRNEGIFVGYLYSYLSPNIIFMSISFFIFIKYISENVDIFNDGVLSASIKTISSASLGIYFIHAMVLYVLNKGDLGFQLSAFSGSAIYSIPATAITTFIISFIIIYLIQKVPIVQKIVP